MKTKTVLFGAGQGAKHFMRNTRHEREFVAFIDNDAAKIGSFIEGVEVFSPSLLDSIEFEQVAITTQWAMEVKQQLTDKLGISQNQIVLPEKRLLKNVTPFENPNSKQLGRNIIRQLSSLAIEHKIPLVVDFGTLLGITRDGDIIDWDDDIDFSVNVEYGKDAEELLLRFIEQSQDNVIWRIERVVSKKGMNCGLLLKFSDSNNEYTEFTTSVCFREKRDGKSLHLPSLGMWFSPEEHFNKVATLQWHHYSVQVPDMHESYLSFQYGNWRKPKKNISLDDYANLQEVSFSDVQEAGITAQEIVVRDVRD